MSINNNKTPLSTLGEKPQPYRRGNVCVCRRHGGSIILAALDRPAVRNAFHDDLYLDLIDLLRETSHDASIAAIVLTGTGDYFSSGADLRHGFGPKGKGHFEPEEGGRNMLHKPAGRFMMALISYPKIIAAAVQGPAVGIGVTLLLHCDLVRASPAATFWIPFTRLALVPELCSSAVLPARMGMPKANELLLLGKKINAQTAYDWNLISQVDRDAADTAAISLLGNPFHPNSLASRLAADIYKRLLSLPMGCRTVEYFCALIKGTSRRQMMEQVCRDELIKLDERFDSGQVKTAGQHVQIGSQKRTARKGAAAAPKSKL